MRALQEPLAPNTPERLNDPQSDPGTADFLDILILFAKRKKLILLVTIAAAVLSVAVALLIPARYTATATIMTPQQTGSTASMLMSQLAGTGLGSLASLAGQNFGLKNPSDLYVGMLKSRTVEDAIIAKFGFQEIYKVEWLSQAQKKLEKSTDITTGKDSLIDISFEDKDPKRAAAVANAYVNELRTLTQQLAVTEASQRRLFFDQRLKQAKDDLAEAEVALKESQQKTGMIQLESQAKATIEAIARIRALIAAKEVQLQAMGSFATEQNPDYVLAQRELAGLQTQLAKFESAQSPDSADPLVASGKIPAVGLEYVRRYREVKYREAIFGVLAKQYEAARLDEAKEATIIQVVDVAVAPDHKSSPHRTTIVIAGTMAGFLAGLIFVILAEGWLHIRRQDRTSTRLSKLKAFLRN